VLEYKKGVGMADDEGKVAVMPLERHGTEGKEKKADKGKTGRKPRNFSFRKREKKNLREGVGAAKEG